MKLHAPAIIYAVMCLLAPLCLSAQDIAPIRLQQRATAYIPRSFYVSDVTDSLPGKAAIGMVTDGSKKQPVTIQDGVAAAFKNYITHGQRRADNSQPVVMNVNKLDIDIKKKGSVWQVSAAMGVVFYAGGMRLVEYSGKGVAEVADPVDYVGGFISKALDNDLQRFDSWWAANKSRVPVSSAVKVNVTVSKVTTRPHHIVYNLRRPLQISDFTGPPAVDAPEFAATYSGMEFSSAAGETENGQMVINVVLTPYFDEATSWFKEAGKNPVLLAHEQAHFDVTAIKTCGLANAIRQTAFTKDNYLTLLSELEKKYVGESNAEQNVYDAETVHGTVTDKQQEWQQRLSKEVRAAGCY